MSTSKKTKVPALPLPTKLPTEGAMRSWRQNGINYEPDFWEFEYLCRRYLQNLSSEELVARHQAILKNMQHLLSVERDAIPSISFLSSWYWFRKEHQARYEFLLRGVESPAPAPNLYAFDRQASQPPIRPKHPNAGDVLYRFGSFRHLLPDFEAGLVRISPASSYSDSGLDSARKDEEKEKSSYMVGQYTKITASDGRPIPIIGDVKKTVSTTDYYLLSMAADYDELLFDDFGSDCYMVVADPDRLAGRLEANSKEQLPGWVFHHNPVEYFDPYEVPPGHYHDPLMTKDFSYAYQREYRFIWMPKPGARAGGHLKIPVGQLADIGEVLQRQ